MTTTRTEDVKAIVKQILHLEMAGYEIVRVTVPNREAEEAVREIKKQIYLLKKWVKVI